LSAASSNRILIALEALAGVGVVAAIVGKTYGPAPTVFFMLAALATAFAVYMMVKMGFAWNDESLDVEGKTRDTEREKLEMEKLLLLQGIKELEVDVASGKVDRRDYEYLRSTAEARAVDIIARLKDDDAHWKKEAERYFERKLGRAPIKMASDAPRPVAASVVEAADPKCFDDRSARFEANACTACRQLNDADAHYCIGCGRPKEVEARA
jgi:hypothetical protein